MWIQKGPGAPANDRGKSDANCNPCANTNPALYTMACVFCGNRPALRWTTREMACSTSALASVARCTTVSTPAHGADSGGCCPSAAAAESQRDAKAEESVSTMLPPVKLANCRNMTLAES